MAAGAAADDRCLMGDATLADQRALAAVAGAVDAACPCAAYTGAPGHRRPEYRRCAKAVIDAALSSATLRSACRETALSDVRSATCGTGHVACGRIASKQASKPVTC